ncbi:hypothetical protein AB0A74_03065 [Saccharothrix sp. NPDC042600]|uniref:hypothetical protein n=1 Tax=Saccharothrix sp. NPDC042600 TaxID=3154492 RepID=UPI00340EFD5E|nr:hypothetical protein GCM10017745_67560 [Saccharothrix mutabilis subsp. capreolus]
MTRFLRQSSGPRHLSLRLGGGVHRDLALVDMLSLSTSTARLSTAFTRFAGDRWVTRYRPDRGVRTTAHATHFEGWAAGWQTLAAPLATVVAMSYALLGLEAWFGVDLDHDLHGPTELMAWLAVFACGFGVLLASRRRCTLTLDDTGVEMRLGRERASVCWDDVRHIQLATGRSQAKNKYTGEHDTGTEIVLIPSRDGISTAPWKLVAFLRRQHGALLLCTIDHFWLYLDTSDEALDRALRSHAGPRRRLPPTTREVLPGKSH